MKKKIKGTVDLSSIKRCYIGGAVAKVKCPKCGSKLEHDLGEQYLSHPEVGAEDTGYVECEKCDWASFEFPLRITDVSVVVEYDPDGLVEV